MRICLYTATALPKLGGQEAVVDALARQLALSGHEPVVLAPRPRTPLQTADSALPYPLIRHPRFFSTRDFVWWYRRFLQKAHSRHRFDVIHCHDVYPTGYVAALCKPRIGLPLVITSHGGDIRENNPRMQKRGIPQRCMMALRAADALISIGRFTEEGFRRLWPQAARIVTIPNGIDLEVYEKPAARPQSLDARVRPGRYVLFLGRLARRKGVDLLLEALALLPDEGGVQLVVAGSGEEQPALEERSRELGLQQRVRFVGRVDGIDKIYLLQNAICTVMPSRIWEAFPLVVLESYAAGKPIIGSAVPGIIDLLQDRVTGRLVTQEDPRALAAVLRQAFTDPGSFATMGRAAARVAQGYSWDSVAQRHLELYNQLIAEARTAAACAG